MLTMRISLWSDMYQDHGFWLVCLDHLHLLVVKWPVSCTWVVEPRGLERTNRQLVLNQEYRTHVYIYSKYWVRSVRVSLWQQCCRWPMATPFVIHFQFGNTFSVIYRMLWFDVSCLCYNTIYHGPTLRKDFVILQLYWWLFSSTKDCFWNMV